MVGEAEGQIAIRKGGCVRKGGCACYLPVVRVGGLWLGTLRVTFDLINPSLRTLLH